MNQHYFDVPFAFSGDKTAIPDPLQVGGTVSMTEGWNFNYQRNLSTDPAALPIDRSTTNWLFNQITIALQALQQQGVPEWITSAQNGGVAYSYGKGAVVLWSATGNAPFNKYVNLNAANTNTPSAGDPQGLTTGWQIEVDPISTAAQASAGTDDASIMTPLKVASQVALRALLAGSATQVFNVATAVSATQALQQQQKGIARFTANGSFVAPVTGTYYVSGTAGGGGGGSTLATNSTSNVTGGSGGGAGQWIIRQAFTLTAGVSYPVTIGTGGTGGTAAANNAGNGTNTQLGSGGTLTINLTGGSGGLVGTGGSAAPPVNYGGPGGGAGFPQGDSASDTQVFAGQGAGQNGAGGFGGAGGCNPFGQSGPAGRGAAGSSSGPAGGAGFGAGGSGAGGAYASAVSAPGVGGANGLPGFLMIEW